MKRFLFSFLFLFTTIHPFAQGNYVFSGAEFSNGGAIDLSTPGGQTWATDRSSAPGYFSALTGATITGASTTANVNGYVKKYGAEAFTFPVGSGTDLRTLSISAPSNPADAFATAWIEGNPDGNLDPTAPNSGAHSRQSLGAGIISVSPVGQWDWQDFNNDGAGLTITVSLPDVSGFALTNNLRLVGWNGGIWIDLSGSPTASGNTANSTLTGTMVAGITAIGIASTTWPLPIKYDDFTATEKDCSAYLTWTILSPNNCSYFDIEQSTDGNNFSKTGTIDAKDNAGGNKYHFTNLQNIGTAIFYRIKMVNNDGSFDYSSVRKLTVNCNNTSNYIKLSPNPVMGAGMVTIHFKVGYNGKGTLLVMNNLGSLVANKSIYIFNGENSYSFNTSALAAGTYYVKLADAGGNTVIEVQKLIKQ